MATIGILGELGTTYLKRPSCWQGYRQTVLYLKEYFAAGGDGLEGADLETLEFKVTKFFYGIQLASKYFCFNLCDIYILPMFFNLHLIAGLPF